jgi:DNA-directed RNA polymerase specialized sigma24 family protein
VKSTHNYFSVAPFEYEIVKGGNEKIKALFYAFLKTRLDGERKNFISTIIRQHEADGAMQEFLQTQYNEDFSPRYIIDISLIDNAGLQKVLSLLTEKQLKALTLHTVFELGINDVSKVMKISKSSAFGLIARATQKILNYESEIFNERSLLPKKNNL